MMTKSRSPDDDGDTSASAAIRIFPALVSLRQPAGARYYGHGARNKT